jgi:hypothetical protein
MKRRRGHEWVTQNDTLLQLSESSFDRLYASILTALIGEGSREVAGASTRRQANKLIDAVIEYVRRLMAEGVWKPPTSAVPSARGAGGLPGGARARKGTAAHQDVTA